jgi:hypothetical protein
MNKSRYMKRTKGSEKGLQAEVEDELDQLLRQISSKKSALKKLSKLIPEKNEKDCSIEKSDK